MKLKFNIDLYLEVKTLSQDRKLLYDAFSEVNAIKRYLESVYEDCSLTGTKVIDRALERIFQLIIDGVVNIAKVYVRVDYSIDDPENDPNPTNYDIFTFVSELFGTEITHKFMNEYFYMRNKIVHLEKNLSVLELLDAIDELILYTRNLLENITCATPCPQCGSIIRVDEKVEIEEILFCESCFAWCQVELSMPLVVSPRDKLFE